MGSYYTIQVKLENITAYNQLWNQFCIKEGINTHQSFHIKTEESVNQEIINIKEWAASQNIKSIQQYHERFPLKIGHLSWGAIGDISIKSTAITYDENPEATDLIPYYIFLAHLAFTYQNLKVIAYIDSSQFDCYIDEMFEKLKHDPKRKNLIKIVEKHMILKKLKS